MEEMLAVFVAVEHMQTRPMLDLDLFRHPGFVGVSVATFCIGARRERIVRVHRLSRNFPAQVAER